MIDQANEKQLQTSDSFYDDDSDEDEKHNTAPITTPTPVSDVRIVTSKPPIYRQEHSVLNTTDNTSEPDITEVSSIHEGQHPFQLESMKNVLFGLMSPSSELSSPTYSDREYESMKNDFRIRMNSAGQKHHRSRQSHGNNYDNYQQRLTSSAINRRQQQQRIERENLKIVERLQNIRPTPSLKRDELLSDYERLMGVSLYAAESRQNVPKRPTSTTYLSASSTLSVSGQHRGPKSRPPSPVNSLNSSNSFRSRPSSSTSHRSSSTRKPVWNDRWQQQE